MKEKEIISTSTPMSELDDKDLKEVLGIDRSEIKNIYNSLMENEEENLNERTKIMYDYLDEKYDVSPEEFLKFAKEAGIDVERVIECFFNTIGKQEEN